jgi:hypothetical protein
MDAPLSRSRSAIRFFDGGRGDEKSIEILVNPRCLTGV